MSANRAPRVSWRGDSGNGRGAAERRAAPGRAAAAVPRRKSISRDARRVRRRPAGTNNRAEIDLYDCEVEGTLPTDLDGVFYRVGPDPQYPKDPKYAGDIAFDGEGHVSMFRIKDGHVDYRTRYAQQPALEGAARGAAARCSGCTATR